MKLRDYFAAPGVRILSVILGVLAGGGVALFKGAILGGLVGAVVVLFSSVFFPVWAYLKELPFNKMKKQLPQPLLLDERVDFVINGKRLYGFFVLTEDRMVMIAEGGKLSSVFLTTANALPQMSAVVRRMASASSSLLVICIKTLSLFSLSGSSIPQMPRQ